MTASGENGYEQAIIKSGSWITTDFIREVLEANFHSEVQVIDKILSPAVNEGDNYLSIMHRVRVRYLQDNEEKRINLIIKGFPEIPFLQKILEHWEAFDKEILMYKEVLPRMKGLIKENARSDFIAAESFKCDMKNTVIMEDLQLLGYKMVPRELQFDYNHCIVALRTLARFHALSVEFQKRFPEQVTAIKALRTNNPSQVDEETKIRYRNDLATFGRKLTEVPEVEKLGRCVCRYAENAIENQSKLLKHKNPDVIDVLVHGDSWLPNIMFKYNEEGKAVHAKLVDYQMCRFGSPALDVLHFFFTSPRPEVLAEKMDDLLEKYYTFLCEDFHLLEINQELFTLDQLKQDMSQKSSYCIGLFMILLPKVLLLGDDYVPVTDTIVLDTMVNLFRKKELKEKYCTYLQHFEKLGYIESINAFMSS